MSKNKKNKPMTFVEDAAAGSVGAGSVAVCAMPLLAQLVKRKAAYEHGDKIEKIQYSTEPANAAVSNKKTKKKQKSLGIGSLFKSINEHRSTLEEQDEQSMDTSSIIAKLKGLETSSSADRRDTTTFGLEDDSGGVVRVTIHNDQAGEFERVLQSLMAERSEGDELPEIAEILFKVKDQFDIINVEWPDVEEDEETVQSLDPATGEQVDGMGGEPDPSIETGAEGMGEEPPLPDAGADQTTGLLTQVIDMMKADAEARKAEARAREAEAKTKEADSLLARSLAKVKQEEQYLDMDKYNKGRKEEDREAKRLAQLAKWRHEVASGDLESEADDSMAPLRPNANAVPEEEEQVRHPRSGRPAPRQKPSGFGDGKVAPHDIAKFIINRVK